MESNVHCTNCGKEMNKHAEICTSCGVREGKVINFCYNCGNEIKENQELCLNCGVNPRKMKSNREGFKSKVSSSTASGEVNSILAAILGFFIPGLPSLLWFGQKTKGISMIVGSILLGIIVPPLAIIILGVSSFDAYRLSNKVNAGETLGEWEFF